MSPTSLIQVCSRSEVFLVVKQRTASLGSEDNKCQMGKVTGPHVKNQKAISKWWIGQEPRQWRRGTSASPVPSAPGRCRRSPRLEATGHRLCPHRLCTHMLCPHRAQTAAEGTPQPQVAEPDSSDTSCVMFWHQQAARADLIPSSFPRSQLVPRGQRSPCAPRTLSAAGLRESAAGH